MRVILTIAIICQVTIATQLAIHWYKAGMPWEFATLIARAIIVAICLLALDWAVVGMIDRLRDCQCGSHREKRKRCATPRECTAPGRHRHHELN